MEEVNRDMQIQGSNSINVEIGVTHVVCVCLYMYAQIHCSCIYMCMVHAYKTKLVSCAFSTKFLSLVPNLYDTVQNITVPSLPLFKSSMLFT